MKKSSKIVLIASIVIALLLIIITAMYFLNIPTRKWMDENIFHKTISETKLPTIQIENEKATTVIAYGGQIATFTENTLKIYDKSANQQEKIELSIENPIYKTSGDYLLIGDKNQKNIYLIYKHNLQWKKELEGKISEIALNNNGAVGISLTGTAYKTIIIMYDITGDEVFKTYISSAVTDIAISQNSKKLSYVEVITSNATIQSYVKTISVEKAKTDSKEAMSETYKSETDEIIVKIQYKNENLIIQTDKSVYKYNNNEQQKILEITSNISYVDSNVEGNICIAKETQNINELQIINTSNGKTKEYELTNSVKEIQCSSSVIALNLGNEIHFIDSNGILIKKYTSLKNVKDVCVGETISAILYKDRLEIIGL